MQGYEITRAEKGGYYVRALHRTAHFENPVQFAGSLKECVAFIESQFAPLATDTTEQPKGSA